MTDASLRLEGASVAAAPLISSLLATSFPEPWDERFIASLLHLQGTIAILAFAEGQAQGCILARAAAGEAEIVTLAVRPETRRRGVAAALLARAMAAAAAAGARDLHLEVSEANEAARALYARAGFFVSGRRCGYYADGSDALVLRRALGPD